MATDYYNTPGILQMIIIEPDIQPGVKNSKAFKILGITQLVLGLVTVSLGIAGPLTNFSIWGKYALVPILTGVSMLIAGLLGILAGYIRNIRLKIGGLVVTVLTAIFACFMMIMMVVVGVTGGDANYERQTIGFYSTLLAISVVEFFVAIVHSAYCCAGTCCISRNGVPPPCETEMANDEYMAPGISQMTIVEQDIHPGVEYSKDFKILGIMQLVLGVVCVVLGIATLGIGKPLTPDMFCSEDSATGIWTGSVMITTGFLGILAGKKQNSCLIVSGIVLTICAVFSAGAMFGFEAAGISIAKSTGSNTDQPRSTHLNLHATLLCIAFAEIVIAMTHSIYCCAGTCCKSKSITSQPIMQVSHSTRTTTAGQPFERGITQAPYSNKRPTVIFTDQPLEMGVQYQEYASQWQMNPDHAVQQRKHIPISNTPYPSPN